MRPTRILNASLVLLVCFAAVVPAGAEYKIGVVDTRRLATESEIGKRGLGQIRAMGDTLKREINAKQQAYQAAVDSFRNKSLTMEAEQRQREKNRLEQLGIDLKRAAADARREIEREGKKIESEIQKTILAGLHSFSRENSYDVVLDHLQCLFNSEATMITEDVLRYLDARSPSR